MRRRDVLIVFGATVAADGRPSPALARRIAGAAAFGRHLADPLYIVTGGRDSRGFVEAEVMGAELLALGVDPAAIICEAASTDTLGSVVRCARLIESWTAAAGTLGAVYVCSSPYHQRRCRILLGRAGIESALAPMPADRPAMGRLALAAALLREALAIPYDVAVLALRGNSATTWPSCGSDR